MTDREYIGIHIILGSVAGIDPQVFTEHEVSGVHSVDYLVYGFGFEAIQAENLEFIKSQTGDYIFEE